MIVLPQQSCRNRLKSLNSFSVGLLGLFAKFNPPVVANGKVFVATYGDAEPLQIYAGNSRPTQFPKNYYVAVYGERPAAPPPQRVVDQDHNDVTLVRAATTPLTFDASRCTPIDRLHRCLVAGIRGPKLSSGRVCHEPQYSQLLLAARNHRRSEFRIAERRGDRFLE
jgi:hypothetical protein